MSVLVLSDSGQTSLCEDISPLIQEASSALKQLE